MAYVDDWKRRKMGVLRRLRDWSSGWSQQLCLQLDVTRGHGRFDEIKEESVGKIEHLTDLIYWSFRIQT